VPPWADAATRERKNSGWTLLELEQNLQGRAGQYFRGLVIKSMTLFKASFLVSTLILVSSTPAHAVNVVVNGGFEPPTLPLIPPIYCTGLPCADLVPPAQVPPWQSSVDIELWTSGFLGFTSYQGNQFAEVNRSGAPPLFQTIIGISAGTPLAYSFAHRGRDGNDTVKLKISDLVTSSGLFDQNFTTGNTAWSLFSASTPIIATGNALKLEFIPVFPLGGAGNLIDAVQLNAVPGPLPVLGAGTCLDSVVSCVAESRLRVDDGLNTIILHPDKRP
jgi:hypothetical protein